MDTGNNARLTYRIVGGAQIFQQHNANQKQYDNQTRTKNAHENNKSSKANVQAANNITDIFGIFPNNGWIYLRSTLDRESCEYYDLTVAVSDNGTPSSTATTHIIVNVLDTNDNDPIFARSSYEFTVEENVRRNTIIGAVSATDSDLGTNADLKYNLIPDNTSFHVNPNTGS